MSAPVDVMAYLQALEREIPGSQQFSSRREEAKEARAAVVELIDTLRMSAEALESAAKCVGGDLAIVLGDRARFARNALARVSRGAS